MENKNFDSIVENIRNFNTREEVGIYINSLKLNKNELLKLGKILHCHVNTKDKKEKIIEWIINGTIGAKLRVKAISEIDLSKNNYKGE